HTPETHLIPNIFKTALGQKEALKIFGNDYDTKDGTAIRDYVHIEDLATAHILALEAILDNKISNEAFNIGSGSGYSVKEVFETAKEVSSINIPYEMTGKREGDPAILIADTTKIQHYLGWKPKHDLKSILATAWEWHKNNPEGYK
ncbi:MAG: GDP-mannose 4,6-dehydratase, partial [Vampirovibrionia bacterium]